MEKIEDISDERQRRESGLRMSTSEQVYFGSGRNDREGDRDNLNTAGSKRKNRGLRATRINNRILCQDDFVELGRRNFFSGTDALKAVLLLRIVRPYNTHENSRLGARVRFEWMIKQLGYRYCLSRATIMPILELLNFYSDLQLDLVEAVINAQTTWYEFLLNFDPDGFVVKKPDFLPKYFSTWVPLSFEHLGYTWLPLVPQVTLGFGPVADIIDMSAFVSSGPVALRFDVVADNNLEDAVETGFYMELNLLQDLPIPLGAWEAAVQADNSMVFSVVASDFIMPTGIYAWSVAITSDEISPIFSVTISIGKVVSSPSVAQPVVITNTTPIWTSTMKQPDVVVSPRPVHVPRIENKPAALARPDPQIVSRKKPHRVEQVTYYYTAFGPSHAPEYTISVIVDHDIFKIVAGSKKQGLTLMKSRLERHFGEELQIEWHETITVAEWEAASHNRRMHSINGNTAVLKSKRALEALNRAKKMTAKNESAKANPDVTQAELLKLQRQQHTIIEELVSSVQTSSPATGRKLTVTELYQVLDNLEISPTDETVMVPIVQGYRTCIYCVTRDLNLDTEFFDTLQSIIAGYDQELLDELSEDVEMDDPNALRGGHLKQVAPDQRVNNNKKSPRSDARPDDPFAKYKNQRPQSQSLDREPQTLSIVDRAVKKRQVCQRIAAKIPHDWSAILYIYESPHAKTFKADVWQFAQIPDTVREIGKFLLAGGPSWLLYELLLSQGIYRLIDKDLILDDRLYFSYLQSLLPESEIDSVRAQEKAKHNRLMHALNGNTMEDIRARPNLSDLWFKKPDGPPPFDPFTFMTVLSSVPGLNYMLITKWNTAYRFVAQKVQSNGTITGELHERLPISIVASNPSEDALDTGVLGVLQFLMAMTAKGSGVMELTPAGKILYDRAVTNNYMIAKADAKSFNGYYAVDLVNMVQVPPLYDLCPEDWMLKWLYLYWLMCFSDLQTDKLPFIQPCFYEDIAITPDTLLSVLFNAATDNRAKSLGMVGETLVNVFPDGRQAGVLFIHNTTQTVPQGAPYFYYPNALISGAHPEAQFAVFVALVSQYPFACCTLQIPITTDSDAQYMPHAGRVFIDGETEVHIIMPTSGAERVPRDQADADARLILQPTTGPTATGATASDQKIAPMFFGGDLAAHAVNLCDFLVSWFSEGDLSVTAADLLTTLVRLNTVFNCTEVLKRVSPIFHTTVTLGNPLFKKTATSVAPPGAVSATNVRYVDHMMRDVKVYEGGSDPEIYFDATGLANRNDPVMIIHRTDPTSWNLVATGLYYCGAPAPASDPLPIFIGHHKDFVAYNYAGYVPYAIAAQIWYMMLGLSTGDLLVTIDDTDCLPVYQKELQNLFSSRILTDGRLQPSPGSTSLEAILENIVGYSTAKWNNGSSDLTIYDRYLSNGEGWTAPLQQVDEVIDTALEYVPGIFVDFWFDVLCKGRAKIFSQFPLMYNQFGMTGYPLPISYEFNKATVFPLMSEAFGRRLDADNEMAVLDDETWWNSRWRYHSMLDNGSTGVLMDMFGNLAPFNTRANVTALWPPAVLGDAEWSKTTLLFPTRSRTGEFLFMVYTGYDAGQSSRRVDLGLSFTRAATLRYGRATVEPNSVRQLQKPIKTRFPVQKILLDKSKGKDSDQTPKDPDVSGLGPM